MEVRLSAKDKQRKRVAEYFLVPKLTGIHYVIVASDLVPSAASLPSLICDLEPTTI